MGLKIVIVGGVAGGATAAARARRIDENAEIILIERGEYVSFANCGLPYYVGNVIKERKDLLVTTSSMLKKRFNIDVRAFTEVLSIDRKNKKVEIKNLKSGEVESLNYDRLILSPGAEPIRPPLEGIGLDSIFTLRNIPDVDRIKHIVDTMKPESAVIVGGGFIGLEMAENLVHRGVKVTVVEMLDQVLAPIDFEMAAIVQIHLRDRGVELRLKDGVKSFAKHGNKTIVSTSSGAPIECDMVILSIGVRPENKLAKDAGLEIGERGGIKTDDRMRTSDPDIFAVGDAVEVKDFVTGLPAMIPLAGPANKQGRIAADNALGRDVRYKGTQGTAIVKIFDLSVAATGASEKTLKRNNIPYLAAHTHPNSHAGYYPGAMPMAMKLLFAPQDGKVLGAQIVGAEGTDKRIDVIATAIRAGMTVYDLEELELAYAPPYSSAKDPVNMIGFVAANMLKGDVATINWDEIDNLDKSTNVLIDLRDKIELDNLGGIEGAIHIPLNDLRNKIGELDKSKNYIPFCAVAIRGYIGHRILSQNGFKSRNLDGGFKTYQALKKNNAPPSKKEAVIMNDKNKFEVNADIEVNACGIQCPGPILKLKEKMSEMKDGQVLCISASDMGFPTDMKAWCEATSNELISVTSEKGVFSALIRKGGAVKANEQPAGNSQDKTIVVFSNDLDKALAAFIIANGAASMGYKVTLFFTFWGLNILRRKQNVPVQKDLISSAFGMMMPKGPAALKLSKMNMFGMGTGMMKHVMKNKNVDSLEALIEAAVKQGVRLVACTMTMDIMGIKKEELIDGVEEGGVATYLSSANKSNVNLFI